jgi:PAS domain S-box-containing protein/putative nucleotidyltransferase with HDIG domain
MSKARILIVEDERIVAADIQRSLENIGYSVVATVSMADEAVSVAGDQLPDLVLMDIVLEGEKSGIQAADEIRRRFGIPVVYLTAYADEDVLERAKKSEPYGYIVKPFEHRELHSTIEMALQRYSAEKALRESEEKYRNLVERSLQGLMILQGRKPRIVFANPMLSQITGYRIEELYALTAEKTSRLLHPQDREQVEKIYQERLDGRDSEQPIEAQIIRKDGQIRWVQIFASRIGHNGRHALQVSCIDITERKKAEEDLRQSYEKLSRLTEEIVEVLASAVEMRDPYTAGHQRRVAVLACAIAERMRVSRERIQGLRMAALIHDIGKIYVPAEILSRPGGLSDIEFSLIKNHSQAGYDLLRSIEFPWPVAEIVLQHHERLNGSGFPQGLKGEKILLEARILAVADVVEAMSSHRPYRPAHDVQDTLDELKRKRGTEFDSQVVDCCLALYQEEGFSLT